MQEKLLSTWTYDGVERRYSDRFAGFSLFVSRENPGWKKGLRCASAIGAALIKARLQTVALSCRSDLSAKTVRLPTSANGVHYYDHLAVLRHAHMPALLFEAGVIVNRDEEIQMGDGRFEDGSQLASPMVSTRALVKAMMSNGVHAHEKPGNGK